MAGYKGKFKTVNPDKYVGDHNRIIYRSLMELKFMRKCDSDTRIIRWASEEFAIPYVSSVDGRVHRYFPDMWVESLDVNGGINTIVVEIKPKSQTLPPKKNPKRPRRYINESRTFLINNNKWDAARKFCADKGWEFMIITEKELDMKYGKRAKKLKTKRKKK